jgi:hypothetical protein
MPSATVLRKRVVKGWQKTLGLYLAITVAVQEARGEQVMAKGGLADGLQLDIVCAFVPMLLASRG